MIRTSSDEVNLVVPELIAQASSASDSGEAQKLLDHARGLIENASRFGDSTNARERFVECCEARRRHEEQYTPQQGGSVDHAPKNL